MSTVRAEIQENDVNMIIIIYHVREGDTLQYTAVRKCQLLYPLKYVLPRDMHRHHKACDTRNINKSNTCNECTALFFNFFSSHTIAAELLPSTNVSPST